MADSGCVVQPCIVPRRSGWLALGIGAYLGGFNPFGWILLGVLGLLVAGSLVLQAVKRHRGLCWLRRGAWFGLALAGVPLRATYWLSF